MPHDSRNNSCPKNADARNETCSCGEAPERGGVGFPGDFPLSDLPSLNAVNNCFRYALNELRALASPSKKRESDRDACAYHLQRLHQHIAHGGMPPDAELIIREASTLPIQE